MGPPFGGSQQKYSTGSSFPNRIVNTCPAFRGLILKIYLFKLSNIFVKIIRYILPNHKSIQPAAAFEIVLKTLVEIYGVRFSRNSHDTTKLCRPCTWNYNCWAYSAKPPGCKLKVCCQWCIYDKGKLIYPGHLVQVFWFSFIPCNLVVDSGQSVDCLL